MPSSRSEVHWDRQTLLLAMCHAAGNNVNVPVGASHVQSLLGWNDDRLTVAANWLVDHELIIEPIAISSRFEMTFKGIEIARAVIHTMENLAEDP